MAVPAMRTPDQLIVAAHHDPIPTKPEHLIPSIPTDSLVDTCGSTDKQHQSRNGMSSLRQPSISQPRRTLIHREGRLLRFALYSTHLSLIITASSAVQDSSRMGPC